MPNPPTPTPEQATELKAAIDAGFDRPCDCHVHPERGGSMCICVGHEWLVSDPTRRQRARIWQRLLWLRSQRAVLLAQEGVGTRVVAPVQEAPVVLPW